MEITPGSLSYTAVEVTAVEFVLLSKAEIDWCVGTGEPSDKAGAYAIQGLASRYVSRIEGLTPNVVGLPVGPFTRCAPRREYCYPDGVIPYSKVLIYEPQSRKDRRHVPRARHRLRDPAYTTLGESMQYYKYVDEVVGSQSDWTGKKLQAVMSFPARSARNGTSSNIDSTSSEMGRPLRRITRESCRTRSRTNQRSCSREC